MMFDAKAIERLNTAPNLWLATVRANGTPHLVAIWFVWFENKAYLCTGPKSVKARNIATQPLVSFALEDGTNPLVVEGKARVIEEIPPEVVEGFQRKYDWNINGDETYKAVIEITPTRVRI